MSRSRKPSDRPAVDELMRSLAAKENAFLAREFLAPAVGGGQVRVRIGGVVCSMRVEPRSFVGWGVFRPVTHSRAALVRPATLTERREYLRLFPQVRLILVRRSAESWWAATASYGDCRIDLEGLVPVLMVDDAQTFDCVMTRFDGGSFWFDEVDPRRDAGTAAYLRQALADRIPPDKLDRPGTSAEERAAYELNLWELTRGGGRAHELHTAPPATGRPRRVGNRRAPAPPPAADAVSARLASSLSHAGAQLIEYVERGDSYRVTYVVDGQRYTASVDKRGLEVQVAGICLGGDDRLFDLGSLVGVVREGEQRERGVPRVGDQPGAIPEEHYWHVHPPRQR